MTRRLWTPMLHRFRGRFGEGRCGLCGSPVKRKGTFWCSDRCRNFLGFLEDPWPTFRRMVYERDEHTCQDCGRQMQYVPPDLGMGDTTPGYWVDFYWVVDHITPIALGGPQFDLSNLQLLCPECNTTKTRHDLSRIYDEKTLHRRDRELIERLHLEDEVDKRMAIARQVRGILWRVNE